MKNKMTNNKNITITTAIMLNKNLINKITKNKILKTKNKIQKTKKQMLLTLKEMIKIRSKKKMNKI